MGHVPIPCLPEEISAGAFFRPTQMALNPECFQLARDFTLWRGVAAKAKADAHARRATRQAVRDPYGNRQATAQPATTKRLSQPGNIVFHDESGAQHHREMKAAKFSNRMTPSHRNVLSTRFLFPFQAQTCHTQSGLSVVVSKALAWLADREPFPILFQILNAI